jgi:AcrR family transcriptional regulator
MSAIQPDLIASAERPLRRDAERNRQRILEAAAAVFAERGLTVTLDEIAVHAGVGVGTVYRRFPDKDALIDALFEDRIGRVVSLAEECLEMDDAWEGLRTFVERGLELQAADRGLKELLFCTAHGCERVNVRRERIAPVVRRLVARAQEAGAVREDFAGTDMPLLQIMLGAIVDATRDVQPEAWRRLMGIVLDGLRVEAARTPLTSPPLEDDELLAVMRRLPSRSRT